MSPQSQLLFISFWNLSFVLLYAYQNSKAGYGPWVLIFNMGWIFLFLGFSPADFICLELAMIKYRWINIYLQNLVPVFMFCHVSLCRIWRLCNSAGKQNKNVFTAEHGAGSCYWQEEGEHRFIRWILLLEESKTKRAEKKLYFTGRSLLSNL